MLSFIFNLIRLNFSEKCHRENYGGHDTTINNVLFIEYLWGTMQKTEGYPSVLPLEGLSPKTSAKNTF